MELIGGNKPLSNNMIFGAVADIILPKSEIKFR